MNPTLIELHVPDFAPALEFYSKLRFDVAWKRSPDGMKGYLVLTLEDNTICFWGGNDQIFSHDYFLQIRQRFPERVGGGNCNPGNGYKIVL